MTEFSDGEIILPNDFQVGYLKVKVHIDEANSPHSLIIEEDNSMLTSSARGWYLGGAGRSFMSNGKV